MISDKLLDKLLGKTIHNWFVLEESCEKDRYVYAKCMLCGKFYHVYVYNLLSGNSTRCYKCALKEKHLKRSTQGGKSNQSRYPLWLRYKKLGMLCKEWHDSLEAFLDGTKHIPQKKQIRRVDETKPLGPENVQTAAERQIRRIELLSTKLGISVDTEHLKKISKQAINQRINTLLAKLNGEA